MRKVMALAIVTAVLAVGLGLWSKTTGGATGSITSSSISTMELHQNTDTQKLPDTTVREAY